MEKKCNDAVFGEMTYKHRWYKKQQVSLFNKEWNITIAAKAYSGKPITEAQQNSYSKFIEGEKEMTAIIGEKLKEYINTNVLDLAEYWLGARKISSITELSQVVEPRTLLFKQDGTTILLLDCVWDKEHGIAVELIPEVTVGSQDIFL